MAKIKDDLENKKEFANKELEAIEPGYKYLDEKGQHMHTFDGKPLIGTSSMSKVLAKPLTWWAAGLAVTLFGWINKGNARTGWIPKAQRLANAVAYRLKISNLSNEEYLNLLDEAYANHTKKLESSAKDGVDMHAEMEKYIKHCLETNKGIPDAGYITNNPKVKILVRWSMEKVKRFLWSEVHCYSLKWWLGGISDAGFEDKDGKYGVLDFKSSKEVYLDQFWQAVGYATELEENGGFTKDGVKLFDLEKPIDYVAVLPFGMEKPEVQYNFDMAGGREAMSAMLTLYKKIYV